MFYYVYVLRSEAGKYYIGSTEDDLERRLKDHNSGKVRSTKNRGPFKIVYQEEVLTRSAAVQRELQIKSYKTGNAFRKLIRSN